MITDPALHDALLAGNDLQALARIKRHSGGCK